MNKSNLLLTGRLEVTRQLLMGSHCGGREHLLKQVAWKPPRPHWLGYTAKTHQPGLKTLLFR
ncbi:hypothetical protein [Nostoc sp.]|uniref:hypothetical protein n=1 Tax=Nostoc sp. TaxID=1180 RepID=UPI002FF9852E